MSELSDKTNAPAVTESLDAATELGAQVQPKSKPVRLWAIAGGLILILELYVWIRWLTSPYLKTVPSGPSDPPTLMKIILITWTVVTVVGFPVGVYYFIIRPWRRERRITTDGMLLVACGLLFFQDPLLDYTSTWCTYNSWLWNVGSWVPYIPGWQSPEKPGHMLAEPLLMNAPGYSYGVLLCTILGCAVMRRAKKWWPNLTNIGLIGVLIVWSFVFDFIMEGLFLMPMGLFTYPGAIKPLTINAGHYYQWPVYEGVMWGGVQAGLCALRYFTDDRGRTFVERGLERVQGGAVRKQGVRFLAIFAACSMFFLLLYNVPVQWFALHQQSWPADITSRSYFTDSWCGAGTNTLCPDPSLPKNTNDSGTIDPTGKFILPKGKTLPTIVPFDTRR